MNPWEAAALAVRTGRPAAMVTVLSKRGSAPRHSGAHMVVFADGEVVGTIGGGAVEHRLLDVAREAMVRGAPTRWSGNLSRDLGMCCGGEMEVFVEPLDVRAPFWVFGAGHVAAAVVPLLVSLDFAVTVVDERPEWAREARFPGAAVRCEDPGVAADQVGADAWVLVVTHDHALDQALCETLLSRTRGWFGLIGSRAKAAKFRARLEAAGVAEDARARLRSPVGLDLGAETPAEIAVSIAADVVATRRGRAGGAG